MIIIGYTSIACVSQTHVKHFVNFLNWSNDSNANAVHHEILRPFKAAKYISNQNSPASCTIQGVENSPSGPIGPTGESHVFGMSRATTNSEIRRTKQRWICRWICRLLFGETTFFGSDLLNNLNAYHSFSSHFHHLWMNLNLWFHHVTHIDFSIFHTFSAWKTSLLYTQSLYQLPPSSAPLAGQVWAFHQNLAGQPKQ